VRAGWRSPGITPQSPTFERLEDQAKWYSRESSRNQRRFKLVKTVEIVVAAAIPVLAGFQLPVSIIGGLGALIVVLEGIQHLNQYQHNWTSYRSTSEALKHEKFLYLAKAGPYIDNGNADSLLAERVEALISQEHTKWVSAEEQAARKVQKGSSTPQA
jgi:hypothetical protein